VANNAKASLLIAESVKWKQNKYELKVPQSAGYSVSCSYNFVRTFSFLNLLKRVHFYHKREAIKSNRPRKVFRLNQCATLSNTVNCVCRMQYGIPIWLNKSMDRSQSKLITVQGATKLPVFHENLSSLPVWSMSWQAKQILNLSSYVRSTLILSSHTRLDLISYLFLPLIFCD
jgi:hypothetical protein